MTDDRLEAYRSLLTEVRGEIEPRRRQIAELEGALRDLESQERLLAALCREEIPPEEALEPAEASGTTGSFSADVRAVARRAIREAGRPLDRAAILEAARKAGVTIPEPNGMKRVGKVLSMDGGLENRRGEGYVIRDLG